MSIYNPEESGDRIAIVDVDEAYSISGDDDSVYFAVAESGGAFYVSAMVDSETGHFTDDLMMDDGPYATEGDAIQAGINCAIAWMAVNGITDYEMDSRIPTA